MPLNPLPGNIATVDLILTEIINEDVRVGCGCTWRMKGTTSERGA